MKKEITKEELLTHKSKLRVFHNELKVNFDPYPFLPIKKQMRIYAKEVLNSNQGFYWQNENNGNYILEDKYQGTTSDPVNMMAVLDRMAKIKALKDNE